MKRSNSMALPQYAYGQRGFGDSGPAWSGGSSGRNTGSGADPRSTPNLQTWISR